MTSFFHRRVPAIALAAALGMLCLAAAASAAELRPGIIGEDDRVRVDERGPPWDAIGQVNVGGYRRAQRCTGTLIAADLVLTAAHCVMDEWKKAPFPLHDIHFLAGVRGSENSGHATAKCLHFPKGYGAASGAEARRDERHRYDRAQRQARHRADAARNQWRIAGRHRADACRLRRRPAVCAVGSCRMPLAAARPGRAAVAHRLRYPPGKLQGAR